MILLLMGNNGKQNQLVIMVINIFSSETHIPDQLTIMCTTRGEHRLISIRSQKECMERKLPISCRMIHNCTKIFHVVQEL